MAKNPTNIRIGKNIRIRRSLVGFSQSALGERLGVTCQQVQKYEAGSDAVSPARFVQLGRIFDCGIEEFFRDTASFGHETALPVPSGRAIHLVTNFERIGCEDVQRRISDFVRALADRES